VAWQCSARLVHIARRMSKDGFDLITADRLNRLRIIKFTYISYVSEIPIFFFPTRLFRDLSAFVLMRLQVTDKILLCVILLDTDV